MADRIHTVHLSPYVSAQGTAAELARMRATTTLGVRSQIEAAARLMLSNETAFMSGLPFDADLQILVARAAVFGAAAYEAAPCDDSGTYAMVRSILTALIDPLHPDLDYLRADPKAAIEARASRHCDTCGRIQHAHNCGERE